MKKTSKKIFALIIAAMFVLASVPFSATAADDTTNNIKIYGQRGVTYQLYKVADYSQTSGAYTPVCQNTEDPVNQAIKSSSKTSADLLAALDGLSSMTGYGTEVQGEVKITDTEAPMTYQELADGIYYFKAVKLPVDADSITKNSVFVVPAAKKSPTEDFCEFNVASKVKMLGEVDITKKIIVPDGQGSSKEVDRTTAGFVDPVLFKLTADVTGSNDNPLTKYMIADSMSTNLDAINYTIESVRLVKEGGSTVTLSTAQYDKLNDTRSDAEITAAGGARYDFIISLAKILDPTVWQSNDGKTFYDFDRVEVMYTSYLIGGARSGIDETNHDDLFYSNANVSTDKIESTDNREPGDDVYVKGFNINVYKVDTDRNPLAGAEFDLYYDRDKTEKVTVGNGVPVKAISGSDGVAYFCLVQPTGVVDPTRQFLAKPGDTFYAVETKAPEGYNLNSTPVAITVGTNGQVPQSSTIINTKTMLPETGGAGTMMFTIIGASLMVVAGALFVVVYKKRSAK